MEDLPVWSPKGESLAFNQQFGLSVSTKPASGAAPAETIWKQNTGYIFPQSWSADGQYIVYTTRVVEGGDIGAIPVTGEKKPVTILDESDYSDPKISPNSRWMAYASNESGRYEINVVSFPKPEGKWQISVNGGTRPRWRRDGKELFYISPSGQLMAVGVNGDGAVFQKGVPKVLFNLPGPRIQGWFYNYDVAQNGERFLFNKVLQSSEPPRITIVSNWQALVREGLSQR
jgi:Tol biopolymer transport system component